VGKVIEVAPRVAKISLVIDVNSKIPAKVLRTREEGVVFGVFRAGRDACKIKYIQEIKVGDQVISSGLGGMYPKGFLIGEVLEVNEEKAGLYKIAEIKPALKLTSLEEVMIVIKK
ncbi:MAG: rod shape-determining protein MreC, partial [Omnitrophica bacterium]|nr:rod shape-determining protein MreC [Candidatus Omnitrophota bacterium]